MTHMLGADPDVLDNVAAQCGHAAARFDALRTSLGAAVQHAPWHGHSADQFRGSWNHSYARMLLAAAESLRHMQTALHRNAQQQRQASSAAGGTIGSAAGVAAAGVGAGSLGGRGSAHLAPANLLAFAKDSYRQGSAGLPAGWARLDKGQLEALGLDPNSLHNRGTGLDATVYSDGKGHYVISYAGSHDGRDWMENGKGIASPVIPNQSGQTEQAVDIAHQLATKVGAGNLTITGHSLGGRDAAVASIATGSRAVTFNAAGVTDEDVMYAREIGGHHVRFDGYLLDKMTGGASLRAQSDQSLVTNYTTLDDPVTNGQRIAHELGGPIVGTREAFGEQVVVMPNNADLLTGHNLDTFDGEL